MPLLSAADTDESTAPGCTVKWRTCADRPARRESSARIRSIRNCLLRTAVSCSRAASRPHQKYARVPRTRTSTGRDRVPSAMLQALPLTPGTDACEKEPSVPCNPSENTEGSHENILSKYLALPCPPEPVIAHHLTALHIILRVRRQPEHVKLEHISPELLKEERPLYTQEGSNASVAYEVQNIWIPALTSTSVDSVHPIANKRQGIEGLTCVQPRLQTQVYSARKPSRANEPRRQG